MNSLLLTLNLQEDTILLNQGVLDVLGHPRQVQILINEELVSLLLRACTIDDLQAVVVPEGRVMQFEIISQLFSFYFPVNCYFDHTVFLVVEFFYGIQQGKGDC